MKIFKCLYYFNSSYQLGNSSTVLHCIEFIDVIKTNANINLLGINFTHFNHFILVFFILESIYIIFCIIYLHRILIIYYVLLLVYYI